MSARRAVVAWLALVCVRVAVPAHAQTPSPEGAAEARVHVGGVALDPRLAISDVGVDTNVFNEAGNPTRDTTVAIGPALDAWLHPGRVSVVSTSSLAWNYFRRAASQRSFDASQAARVDVDLGYLIPHGNVSLARSRQRPNLEIDARVRRRTTTAGGGVVVRLGVKVWLDVEQQRRHLVFGDAIVGGRPLSEALNRRETETAVTGRYVLTPLTTFVVRMSGRRDRFEANPIRNSNSLSLTPGLEFKPLALVAGKAMVGYRRFSPTSAALPGFRGLVSDVGLRYRARDLMVVDVSVARDVDYSYELLEPYYISTGLSASVTQAIGAGWDIVGRAQRTGLAYQGVIGAARLASARTDRILVYGMGVGRHVGSEVRVGFDVNHVARRSTVADRSYEGLRMGGSLTYGF